MRLMSRRVDISLAVTFTSFYVAFLSLILHDLASDWLGREDSFFYAVFSLASLLLPLAIIFSSIVWLIDLNKKRKKSGGSFSLSKFFSLKKEKATS